MSHKTIFFKLAFLLILFNWNYFFYFLRLLIGIMRFWPGLFLLITNFRRNFSRLISRPFLPKSKQTIIIGYVFRTLPFLPMSVSLTIFRTRVIWFRPLMPFTTQFLNVDLWLLVVRFFSDGNDSVLYIWHEFWIIEFFIIATLLLIQPYFY